MNTARVENPNKIIQFPGQQVVTLTADQLQALISQAVTRAMANSVPEETSVKKERRAPTASPYKTNGVKKARAAEPLYDASQFEALANYFLNNGGKHGKRNYMMLVLGCTVGNRGGDLLQAKLKDVLNADGSVKNYYEVYEQKTGKFNRNKITATAKDAIVMYVSSLDKYTMDDYLIQSQKGGQMSIQQMWRILNDAGKKIGLTQNIGTHTLRKTYGYTARMANDSDSVMDTLQAKFNHSDQRITKAYLTITQGEVDKLADSVEKALMR
jgi:integrase